MDRTPEDPGVGFALRILRDHPQISYEHAVSAAEYAGAQAPTRSAFREAARRLGLSREDLGSDDRDADGLVERVEGLREQVRETTAMREALLRIQKVVRTALDEL